MPVDDDARLASHGTTTQGDPPLELRRGATGMLDLDVVEATPRRVELRVVVDERLHQPFGLLHGGVSALVAEHAAHLGGAAAAGPGTEVVGIELNASHLRAMRRGTLVAVATPVRVGRTVQVWAVELHDEAGRAICRARCTLAVSPAGASVVP